MIREVLVAALLVRLGMAAEEDPVKKAVAEVDAAVELVAGRLTEEIARWRKSEVESHEFLKTSCGLEGIIEPRIERAQSARRVREEALARIRVLHGDFVALARQASIPSESQKELLKNMGWAKQETIRRIWEGFVASALRQEFVEPLPCKCFAKAPRSSPVK